jgi:FtsZ-binding cell division protein ZapB
VNRQASRRGVDGSNPFIDILGGLGGDGTASPGGIGQATPPRVTRPPTTATPNLAATTGATATASSQQVRTLEEALRTARADIETLKKQNESLTSEADKANRRAAQAMNAAAAASSASTAAATTAIDVSVLEDARSKEAMLRREKDGLELQLKDAQEQLSMAQARIKTVLDQVTIFIILMKSQYCMITNGDQYIGSKGTRRITE